ncbi:MAG: hypothetical protein JNM56_13940, partial [Planctomycetia bacterium]|nr:hypothetical protein [Planctomycetia bacterium]
MWTLLTPAWKWFWQPSSVRPASRKRQGRQPAPAQSFRPRCEQLEDRVVPAVAAEEQLFVYELNRARSNPLAYQIEQNLPVDLSGVAARPPLAVNNALFDSTEFHAVDMATRNYFSHFTPEGLSPNQMARNAGYVLPAFYPTVANNIESIAFGGGFPTSPTATANQALNQLIIDADTPSLGHRIQLLAMSDFAASHREIGVGHASIFRSPFFEDYWAIHTAVRDTGLPSKFLTGVVYGGDLDTRYELGEGINNANIQITPGAGVTVLGPLVYNAAGGWSIPVSGTGEVTIQVSGGSFSGTSTAVVTLGSDNIAIDFVSGRAAGIVNFDDGSPAPNLAPVLNAAANPTLPGTVEDTASAATLISTLVDTEVTDPTGPAKGIAVIGTGGTSAGNWQYSADGVTFVNFGAVSASSALLLPDTYQLRFAPTADASGTASITYRAWDQSSGTAEGTADLSQTSSRGGSTAFSTATKTLGINIAPVNDAPVLNNAGTPTLPSINEDTTNPAGVVISTLLGTSVTDVDTSALRGIAVTGVTGTGTWQYSTNGGSTWINFGAPSDGVARLLRDTDRIRFVPAKDFNGQATITFRAWDRTSGTAGGTGNASVNGGITAFSTALETATVNIVAINDAPVLGAGTSVFTPIQVNNRDSAGDTVASLLGASVTDVDAGAQQG